VGVWAQHFRPSVGSLRSSQLSLHHGLSLKELYLGSTSRSQESRVCFMAWLNLQNHLQKESQILRRLAPWRGKVQWRWQLAKGGEGGDVM